MVRSVSLIERTQAAGALSVAITEVCPCCGSVVARERAAKAIEPDAIAMIREELSGASKGCHRFFDLLWAPLPGPTRSKDIAKLMHVNVHTLGSRFHRAGLPMPKLVVTEAALVRAAHLLSFYPTSTVSAVANVLEHSSSQSFGRFIKTFAGMSAQQFRYTFDGPRRLDHFRDTLIRPYRDAWLSFEPVPGAVWFI